MNFLSRIHQPSLIRRLSVCCAFFVLLVSSELASALESDRLVGLWLVKDRAGEPRALLRIAKHDDEYHGVIEKGLRRAGRESPYCTKCPGNLRGRPLVGMTILSGMKKDGDAYTGGTILDPDSGKIYNCRVTLLDEGRRLKLRGYVGNPMFGRSRILERVEDTLGSAR